MAERKPESDVLAIGIGSGNVEVPFSGRSPVVLLPVRIETRFERQPQDTPVWLPQLMVRVYPDEIAIDTHDLRLTDTEGEAAKQYWSMALGSDGEKEAWRWLLMTYPSTRAAWIVRSTAPPSIEDDKDFNLFLPPRTSAWSRAATYVMPDRWHFLGYRGGERVVHVVGNAIPPLLAISPDPSLDPDDPNAFEDVSGHGLLLERGLRWTVDFEAAVQVGMAVRLQLPLSLDGRTQGLDQLFVVGVKSSANPAESAAWLGTLFNGHHYTRGFALLKQGTPLHNTSESRSPFGAPDPSGERSFAIERGAPMTGPTLDGNRFHQPLGIFSGVTAHVENANGNESMHARAFREALWPATLGYYMRQMLHPLLNPRNELPASVARFDERFPDTVDSEARAHFIEYVDGLTAFRVGAKAYGLLPVTSLQRWQPSANATRFDRALPPLLQSLSAIASSNLRTIPRLGRTSDVEADLLGMLGTEARSRRVYVRSMLGPTAYVNLLNLLGISSDDWETVRRPIAQRAMGAIGHPEWDGLIDWMSFDTTADLFVHELVASQLSETAALSPNYISWIRTASVDALRETVESRPAALLFHVLRYATLTEYDRLASLLEAATFGSSVLTIPPDQELPGFNIPGSTSAWHRLYRFLPAATRTVAEILTDPSEATGDPRAHLYRKSLAAIEGLPTTELERLFTTTLDLCSHRFDAWVTSLAAKRLSSMRSIPTGSHLGGYGWVENVRPGDVKVETLSDGRVAFVQKDPEGYVHTSAMAQASAAAVLRNMTRQDGSAAFDVSSERAGKALRVLEKIRSGESLGSVLGHLFERSLRSADPTVRVQEAIDFLRLHYPLVANKLVDSHQPADAIAARNVVDGLQLHDAFRAGTLANDDQLLPPGSNERLAIDRGLDEIRDTIDAISDLLTAESVFQSLRGNIEAAAASLDTFAHGTPPPDIECVRQPRGGTALTHRFAIILGSAPPDAPAWTAPSTPRSRAEPYLDAWIGGLLGDPSTIRCRVKIPSPSLPGVTDETAVSLGDLQLRPIDFLALASQSADSGGETPELDLRIARRAGPFEATIDHAPWPDRSIRSFAEAIAVARAIRDVIGVSRPLRREDLVMPARRDAAKQQVDTGGRAVAARAELEVIRGQLEVIVKTGNIMEPLVAAFEQALLFGIRDAFFVRPLVLADIRDELVERGRTVLKEVERRLASAANQSDEEMMHALFGPDFVVLPEFDIDQPAELAQALAHAPALAGDSRAVTKWIHQAAAVRDPLERFRTMTMYATASGAAAPSFDVVQLPFVAGASWVALPFADEAHRPPSGRVSIVLQRTAAPPETAKWAGLFVDEWSEVIPSASEQTAISFPYDSPRAEAPQAVLIAVPPVESEWWDFDALVDCVRETLHLAKLRGGDLETLGAIGQLVPALCLASNVAGNTVSAGLSSMLGRPAKEDLPES